MGGRVAALKAVLLKGLEIVFIVIAVGAGRGLLLPASLGALAACVLVLSIGAAVHRPLSRVPEDSVKFGVGVMLSAFGVFWTGEGLGIAWPGQDLALLFFAALFLAAGLIGSSLARKLRIGLLFLVGVLHSAALAPLALLSDTLALATAAPDRLGNPAARGFHYGWVRGAGSAAFILGSLLSGGATGQFGIAIVAWLNAALLALAPTPMSERSERYCDCRSIAGLSSSRL